VRALVGGSVKGELLILDDGLSFWGGYDPESGVIIDRAHPQSGVSLTGKIVAMPHGRGSSSSSYVLAESIRLGTAPAGIVLGEPDSILVIGAMVARLLYGVDCPIYVADLRELSGGEIELGGV
jgi:predicted aconitase with swiveling domain